MVKFIRPGSNYGLLTPGDCYICRGIMTRKFLSSDQFLFGLHYAALFSGVGIVLPHFPNWLTGKGFSEDQVGLVLGGAFLLKVIIGPMFSTFADMSGSRKSWLFLLAGGYFLSVLALHAFDGFWAVLLLWSFGGALATTQIPISDSISVLAVRQRALDYGPARLWGSISFIVVSVVAGWYLEGRDIGEILNLLTIFTGLAVVVVLFLPNLKTAGNGKSSKSLWETFKISDFRTFILIAALVQASHAALYGFATIHWIEAGLSETQIGLLWAEGVIIEVLVFAYGRKLLIKLDIAGLIGLAVIGGLIRWLVMGLTTDLYALALIQMLHACTFAATHLAVVTYISRCIPDRLSASAQGLYDVLAMGIIFAGAMWVSGWLYAEAGGKTFWIMGAMVALAGILLLANLTRIRNSSCAPAATGN